MIKNVKIRFNLNNENDRKAYDYLQDAEKSYSKAVISAICEYLGLSERTANEDAFLERVIATIKEELAKTNPFGGVLQFVQTPPAQIPAEKRIMPKPKKRYSISLTASKVTLIPAFDGTVMAISKGIAPLTPTVPQLKETDGTHIKCGAII